MVRDLLLEIADRMARDQIDMTPIETRDELVAWIAAGEKPESQFRVGTEHEKFPFLTDTLKPVPYFDGRAPSRRCSRAADRFGWEPVSMKARTSSRSPIRTAAATFRWSPAASSSLSGAPLKPIHETCEEPNAILQQVREVADRWASASWVSASHPPGRAQKRPVMPKGRYKIMRATCRRSARWAST
jgi:glutamate--cysteine ligase